MNNIPVHTWLFVKGFFTFYSGCKKREIFSIRRFYLVKAPVGPYLLCKSVDFPPCKFAWSPPVQVCLIPEMKAYKYLCTCLISSVLYSFFCSLPLSPKISRGIQIWQTLGKREIWTRPRQKSRNKLLSFVRWICDVTLFLLLTHWWSLSFIIIFCPIS